MPHRRGFTLLELIIVLTIMGFLAAMILPAVGRVSTAERIKLTQDRLEEIRTAIVGPRFVFDDAGNPVIGGYVGDVGALPELVRGRLSDGKGASNHSWDHSGFDNAFVTDSGSMQWVWDDWSTDDWTVDGVLLNHPAGLFENPGNAEWRGPYCGPGKDPYRNDHSGYADTVTSDADDRCAWALRITGNRLNDAWGRSLLFWRDGDDLWIISEGPNMKSAWDASDYKKDEAVSKDDIVVVIRRNEWNPFPLAERIAKASDELDGARIKPFAIAELSERFPGLPDCVKDIDCSIFDIDDEGWNDLHDSLRNLGRLHLDPWGRAYQVLQYDGRQQTETSPGPPPVMEEAAARRPVWLLSRGPDGKSGVYEHDTYVYYIPAEFLAIADSTTAPNARREQLRLLINDHRGGLDPVLPEIAHVSDMTINDQEMDELVARSADDIAIAVSVH
ncbi:MAG: type II secretion system protein [Planctomycetota bacterium]